MLNKILQSRQPFVSLKIVELETKTLLKKNQKKLYVLLFMVNPGWDRMFNSFEFALEVDIHDNYQIIYLFFPRLL